MWRTAILGAGLVLSACHTGGAGTDGAPASPAHDIKGAVVSYEAGGVTLKGYLAYDAARTGPRPGVLVVHEWWGPNDYARRRATMLAELGYTALALDMYGDGKTVDNPTDAGALAGAVFGDLAAAQARFAAARTLLAEHAATDPTRLAAIGYCFGGGIVLHMARAGVDLKGVASFHGNLKTQTPAAPGAVKAAVLVCHGADDPTVSEADVTAFTKEMANAGVDLEFHAYPGAVHAFTNPDATALGEKFGLPVAYDQAADEQSWAALQAFLTTLFAE